MVLVFASAIQMHHVVLGLFGWFLHKDF